MLLMIKKGIRGGICNAVHLYAKASKKNMRDYEEIEIHLISIIGT